MRFTFLLPRFGPSRVLSSVSMQCCRRYFHFLWSHFLPLFTPNFHVVTLVGTITAINNKPASPALWVFFPPRSHDLCTRVTHFPFHVHPTPLHCARAHFITPCIIAPAQIQLGPSYCRFPHSSTHTTHNKSSHRLALSPTLALSDPASSPFEHHIGFPSLTIWRQPPTTAAAPSSAFSSHLQLKLPISGANFLWAVACSPFPSPTVHHLLMLPNVFHSHAIIAWWKCSRTIVHLKLKLQLYHLLIGLPAHKHTPPITGTNPSQLVLYGVLRHRNGEDKGTLRGCQKCTHATKRSE